MVGSGFCLLVGVALESQSWFLSKRIIIDVCAGRKKVRKFFFNEGERDRENEWT
jgi:hypothetical protein